MAEPFPAKSPLLLGQSLKQLREIKKESLAEAAGAIEIDEKHLANIEAGREVPSEDVLTLLFSHFSIDEQSAIRLRQLAGYDDRLESAPGLVRLPVVMLGIDQRVIYSDGVHIEVGPNGVVINFLQAARPGQPPVAVSRVGMSQAQAEAVAKTLEQALLHAKFSSGPRALPPASDQREA